MRAKKNKQNRQAPQIRPLTWGEIRAKLKFCNLKEVAEKADLSTASVYRIAKGEGDPKASTLKAVSDVLRFIGAVDDTGTVEGEGDTNG